jgi:hypothetical protein
MANKKIWLGILATVLVFGMTVVGCDDGSTNENGDNTNINEVMIRSVSPSTGLTDGVETTFTIVVDYSFYGFENGMLSIQFNSYDAEGKIMSMLGREYLTEEGSGTQTFIVQETPKDHSPYGDFFVRCELGCWNGYINNYWDARDFTQFFTPPVVLSFE